MCVFVVCSRCWVPVLNLGLCLCMASEYCCLHRHPAPCASVVCSRC
ncbi:unnamed protein product [Staurois parvus]|uniref:Uncharacterized protein n=1 Tax=Staurois parvus TaxID=386267 RepID=A0ABN9AEM5_9NEOB|nr:unnamed protein product [Staurois parvus]